MPAIFVSHSSRDQTAAAEITAAIKHLGFEEVFLDFDKDTGIGAGAEWEKTLYENLSRCHAIVLILTPNWLTSHWCRIELASARALGKVILPVICSSLGDRYVLPEIQAIDLIDLKEEGLARLERRLHAIVDELARGFHLDPNRAPYPGIHAFEAEDAAIYFGRDAETRAAIEKLDARRAQGGARLLVIIGASGAGKSSLLKAGLLPQLARRQAQWVLLPVMRPEKAPLEAFAKSLAQHLGTPGDWRAWQTALGAADAVEKIEAVVKDLRTGEARSATVLIPIDQFEELFTIAEPAQRAAFLKLLAAILDPALGLPVMAVATGRADVLQGLIETSVLAPLMEAIPLLPMPLDRVPRLVEGPAVVASLVVQKGLSERIMKDVESPEALPLLAYTLRMLHDRCTDKRLTLDTYLALGDGSLNPVQNAVRLGADEAVARVKPSESEMNALRDAFIPHLVRLRLHDKRHVRQPAPLAALPREAERLVRALIDARLLTARTGEDSEPVVEVAHEALFSAWPTLKAWLDAEQEFLVDLERLKGTYETWAQAADAQRPEALLHGLLLARARDWLVKYPQRFIGRGMDELRLFIAASAQADDAERIRSRRLQRRVFQAIAAAAIVFFAAFIVTALQYLEAERQRHEAEEARGEAVAERNRAERNLALAKRAAASATLINIGDSRRTEGDVAGALSAYQESLGARRELVKEAPSDVDWLRDVSVALGKIGDAQRDLGHLNEALISYREVVAVARKLADADPGKATAQRDVSVGLNKVGDVLLALGNYNEARDAYDEGLAILRKLAAADSGNTRLARDVTVSLNRIGDIFLSTEDRKRALATYEESLALSRKLAAADPGNSQLQRDLSVTLGKVGDARLASGDQTGALATFEESLTIIRQLAAADPGNGRWQADLSDMLEKIGKIRREAGDTAGASAAQEESAGIKRELATKPNVDLSKTTCKEFIESGKDGIMIIWSWLFGYYAEQHGNPHIDFGQLVRLGQRLADYCKKSPTVDLIAAAKPIYEQK